MLFTENVLGVLRSNTEAEHEQVGRPGGFEESWPAPQLEYLEAKVIEKVFPCKALCVYFKKKKTFLFVLGLCGGQIHLSLSLMKYESYWVKHFISQNTWHHFLPTLCPRSFYIYAADTRQKNLNSAVENFPMGKGNALDSFLMLDLFL